MFILRRLAINKQTKLAELTDLDRKIRSFLIVMMDQLEWKQTFTCIHVALCVREASQERHQRYSIDINSNDI